MGFYSLISNDIINSTDIEKIVEQAKLDMAHKAAEKLDGFEPMNEEFIRAALPKNTPPAIIQKHARKINKLKAMCTEKRLKKLLG